MITLHHITDANECDESNGGCEHVCVNLEGGHECACRNGFTLSADGRNCQGRKINYHAW